LTPVSYFSRSLFGRSVIRALRLLDEGEIVVELSPQVREEYEMVLTRPAVRRKNPHLTEERAHDLLAHLYTVAQSVTVIRPYLQCPRDPDDEPFLNLAIQEQVDYLVTRDKDLLDLSGSRDFRLLYPYMRVVDPVTFVREIALRS
jgi:putative PIN family toxin of toxin-antitoxin system